jgi:hypothetical protein
LATIVFSNNLFAQFATQNLDNLVSPTKVNVNLTPKIDNSKNLGSTALSWKDLYLDGALYLDGTRFINNGGTITEGNTAIGKNALSSNTTGFSNTAIGEDALRSNDKGNYNTVVGHLAGFKNSGTAALYNCFFGHRAGYDNISSKGSFFGERAGEQNTTGEKNSFFGQEAGNFNKIGHWNSFFGSETGRMVGGSQNSYFGAQAGRGCELIVGVPECDTRYPERNCGFGFRAGVNTYGSDNSFFGGWAGNKNTTGEFNSFFGKDAGGRNVSGHWNTHVGYNTGHLSGSEAFNNTSILGYNTYVTTSDQVRIGNELVDDIGGFAAWTDLSDARFKKNVLENVPGLQFITQLRPITYTMDIIGIRKFLGADNIGSQEDEGGRDFNGEQTAIINRSIMAKEKIIKTGFIAQEVEIAAKESAYDFSGIAAPKNEHSMYGLRYAEFVVPLVKAVQELDSIVASKDEAISELIKEVAQLKAIFGKEYLHDGTIKITQEATINNALLGQNIPNPFDQSTLIPFRIPKDCKDASIVITEVSSGKIVRAIPVSCGETQISIEAGLLASSTYSYSLYVDGKMIDTKQMILTK